MTLKSSASCLINSSSVADCFADEGSHTCSQMPHNLGSTASSTRSGTNCKSGSSSSTSTASDNPYSDNCSTHSISKKSELFGSSGFHSSNCRCTNGTKIFRNDIPTYALL